jgi:hypothetical protein
MKTILFFILAFLFCSCGSSNVRDTSDNEGSIASESAPDSGSIFSSGFLYQYVIQLAAFETEVDAQKFIEESRDKIDHKLSSFYDEYKKKYSVQLPIFNSRFKAEELLAELTKNEKFANAIMIIKKINVDY